MDKRNISEKDFIIFIDSEKVAFYVYDVLVRRKVAKEYVDIIADTYTEIIRDNEKDMLGTFVKAYDILKTDYNVYMLELPFKNNYLKNELNDVLVFGINKNNIGI